MTFDEIRAMSNRQANEAVALLLDPEPENGIPLDQIHTESKKLGYWKGNGYGWTANEFCSDWRYAGLLEEKLREWYRWFHLSYNEDTTRLELAFPRPHGDEANNLYWPAATAPRRVRCDAFLVAFGGDNAG